MSRWFRFYDTAIDDPKVQRLQPALFKTWVNLLCVASQNNGVLPSMEDLSFRLRISRDETDGHIQALVTAGLLDEAAGAISPHNWHARQFKSDVSTPRVKRFRDGKRNVSETPSGTTPEAEQSRAEAEQSADVSAPAAADHSELEKECERATGWRGLEGISAIADLVDEGFDMDGRILPVMRAQAAERRKKGDGKPDKWAYFVKAIRDPSRRVKETKTPVVTDDVKIDRESPLWEAASAAWFAEKGKLPPCPNGHWYFPKHMIPSHPASGRH